MKITNRHLNYLMYTRASLKELILGRSLLEKLYEILLPISKSIDGRNSVHINAFSKSKLLKFGQLSLNEKSINKIRDKTSQNENIYYSSISTYIPNLNYCLLNDTTPSISIKIENGYKIKAIGCGIHISFNEEYYNNLGENNINSLLKLFKKHFSINSIYFNSREFAQGVSNSYSDSIQDFSPCNIIDSETENITFIKFNNTESINWKLLMI